MRKIPVGETISAAYNFAFAGFLNVLGTLWLPYLVFAAFCVAVVMLIAPGLPGHVMRGEFDALVFDDVRRVAGLIWLASLVVRSMVTVGLQNRALGRTEGPAIFYFSLGAPVWRMIGAAFLAVLILLFIFLLTAAVAAGAAYGAIQFVPGFAGRAIACLVIFIAVCWAIYVCVRLVFLLAPVVVAEERIGLARAWELAGGNFWRIIAVCFVVFVPVAVGFAIVESAVIGPFLPDIPHLHLHPGMDAHDLIDFYTAIVKNALVQFQRAWPFLIALGIIREVVFLGLGNGAMAKAYLAVSGDK